MSKFKEFDENFESFESWEERLQQYFIVNKVEEDLKVPNLITLVGAKTYAALKTELFPSTPSEKTYCDLVAVLKKKFVPVTSIIVERFKFYNRKQEATESVNQYIAALKHLSKTCKFGEFLDQALRDRLVCGVHGVFTQQKLLSEPESMTFTNACTISLSLEAAEAQSKLVQGSVALSVAKLQYNKSKNDARFNSEWKNKTHKKSSLLPESSKSSSHCFRCARKHDPDRCPAKMWECFHCGRKGHTSRVCKKDSVHQLSEEPFSSPHENSSEDSMDLGFLARINYDQNENSLEEVLYVKVSSLKWK